MNYWGFAWPLNMGEINLQSRISGLLPAGLFGR